MKTLGFALAKKPAKGTSSLGTLFKKQIFCFRVAKIKNLDFNERGQGDCVPLRVWAEPKIFNALSDIHEFYKD